MEPSQQYNPYASPGNLPPQQTMYSPSGNEQVSAQTIIELTGTKPWVRLLSILSFLGAGLMGLGAIAMIGVGVFGVASGKGGAEGGAMLAMAIFYGIFAVLMVYPALKMNAYASRIDSLAQSRSIGDLENALLQQRLVWRFWGIVALVYIGVVVLAMMAAVAIPTLLR